MSIISRITTWTVNQILTSSALNGEFNNIVNTLNNLDAATTSWTNVKVATLNVTTLATVPNGTAATSAMAFGQNHYFQTVQATTATSVTTTSSTFTAFTGLSVNITPTSASNRVKITCTTAIEISSGGVSWTLKRGSTELSGVVNGFGFTGLGDGGSGAQIPTTITYIDSPATTSSTTYQFFFRSNNNSTSVQVGRSDVLSVIVVEEIL